ncbi:M23 family metallopeptidase [Ammoniphilus sp. YIM 78166]|uniref:M23 family metallopeptidase n=1 Tax=Ammoniphilus sp. YIM 78166 TaxID=1644106 RepID=UPI00106F2599|nr:M23 family metallopeptidase [Ammoniphilus sp. YIM 78166]
MKKTWIGWSYPGGTELGDINIPDSVLTDPAMIEQYGGYGVDADGDGKADPYNLKDAIYSTANYLRANGAAEGKYREAIFAYNHSQDYVDQVLGLADRYVVRVAVDAKIIEGAAWPVPVAMIITSGFGERWGKHHNGIDIAAPGDSTGKIIVAFAPGVVEYSGFRGSYGNTVIIDHGNGLKTLYAHMMDKGIEQGSEVQAGTPIGYIGNTGDSRGAHLHFEVWAHDVPVDPMKYIQKFNPTLEDGDNE